MKCEKKLKDANISNEEQAPTEPLTDTSTENIKAEEEMSAADAFIADLKSVNDSYLTIVMISMAMVALGVVVAAFISVAAGLACAICAVLLYMFTTKTVLQKKLGITYKSTSGQLSVIALLAKGREEIWIPRRLLWLDVTELDEKLFTHGGTESIRILHLPRTIKTIGTSAFEPCEALTDIYYEGSEEDWKEIDCLASTEHLELHFLDTSLYAVPHAPKKSKDKDTSDDISKANTEDENINK